jgi:hypothetical protein
MLDRMTVTEGRGWEREPGRPAGGGLRREVIVPVHALRRVISLLGISVMLILVASAADAVVWTYQSQERLWLDEGESAREPERPLQWDEYSPTLVAAPARDPRVECMLERRTGSR